MKIGIDIRVLMDNYYSGVSEYTWNLLKALFEIDNVNQYKLFYNSWKDISDHIPNFDYKNVEVINTRYPNKVFNYTMQKFGNIPQLDKFLRVDLFFAPHINFFALSGNCKKIITIHDLSFMRYPEFFSLRKNLWHKIINVREVLNNFDKIVAVSENTKRDIIDLCGIDEKKIKVIYSAVDDDYKKINDLDNNKYCQKIRAKYKLGDKFILYLGTIEPRKNIEAVIEAYDIFLKKNAKYEDYELVLAGGDGWKNNDIYKKWKNSVNKEKIRFLGYVDRNEKVYLYNLAQVFFYPSFYEGFGLPPLEACFCGTPVVTSNSSSIPEVVGNSAFFVDPYDINGMVETLSLVLGGQMDDFVSISKKEKNNFSWAQTASIYLDYFSSLNSS